MSSTTRRSGTVTYRKPPSKWDAQSDRRLLDARREGMNWPNIATTYFPSKNGNACRKRHERLMRDQKRDEWDTVKLETLAIHYHRTRKEMWSLLSEPLNEKWDVIEAKCMEKGANQLSTIARAAHRRTGRSGRSGGMSPYGEELSDDSGIVMDEAESVVGSTDLDDSVTLVSPSQHYGDQGRGFPQSTHLHPTTHHHRGHSSSSSTSGRTPSVSHGQGLTHHYSHNYPAQHQVAFPAYGTDFPSPPRYMTQEQLHPMTTATSLGPVQGLAPAGYNTRTAMPPSSTMQQQYSAYTSYAPYDPVSAPVHTIRSPQTRSRRH